MTAFIVNFNHHMQPEINIFNSVSELTDKLAEIFYSHTGALCREQQKVNIVLSGGNTPQLMYKKIASHLAFSKQVDDWNKVHFFWGDERCVPPHHPESNFGMANRYLLRALNSKETNIHRIRGERGPEEEAVRYSGEIGSYVATRNAIPVFDWIFLGMGDDGHTASIFPDQLSLLYTEAICAVAVHPQSGQQRITLTGKPLIHARRITFIVTGPAKAQRVKEILNDEPSAKLYPARYIKPLRGKLEWFLDKEAARLI
jgi:6-phosphogluconolactonase